jgi:hypothetical protein
MDAEQRIPRFHAYFERKQGQAVMWMSRSTWEEYRATTTGYVAVDIDTTPMKKVAVDASVVAAVAFTHSRESGQLNLYRIDTKDHPLSINEDRYFAHLDIANHPSLPSWTAEASTSLNENLTGFLESHVAFVKMNPGPDHHLPDVPATVKAVWDLHVKST